MLYQFPVIRSVYGHWNWTNLGGWRMRWQIIYYSSAWDLLQYTKKNGSGFDADSLHVHKLNVLRKINLRPVNFETKKCGTNNVSGFWEELHTLLRVKFNCRILVFDPFIGLLKAGFGSFTSYGL